MPAERRKLIAMYSYSNICKRLCFYLVQKFVYSSHLPHSRKVSSAISVWTLSLLEYKCFGQPFNFEMRDWILTVSFNTNLIYVYWSHQKFYRRESTISFVVLIKWLNHTSNEIKYISVSKFHFLIYVYKWRCIGW